MLSLRSVNQFYGQNHTLWDINTELPRGQCTVLLGRNGVGKTTLVNCIMGHVPVVSGSMTGSRRISRRKTCCCSRWSAAPRWASATCPRAAALLAAERGGESAGGTNGRARRPRRIPPLIYSLFPHLRQMRARRAGDLCVGAQRQLAIGRALARAGAADPRRTDGGRPLDRRRYRQRDPPTQPRIGHDHFTGGASAAVRAPGGGPFCLLDSGRTVAHGALAQLDEALIGAGLAE